MNFVYILIQNKQHCNDAVSWPTTSLLRAAFSVMNVKTNFPKNFLRPTNYNHNLNNVNSKTQIKVMPLINDILLINYSNNYILSII